VRYRHCVTVHGIAVRGDAARGAQLGIKVAHQLMAEEIEIDPVRGAAPLGAAEHATIERTCLGNVANLESYVEWSEHVQETLVLVGTSAGASIAVRLATTLLLCAGAFGPAAQAAEVPEEPPTFLSVGPAVQVTPAYPGGKETRTFLLPDIEGQYDNWLYISATDLLGVYAYNHGGDKLGAALEYDFTERLEKDSPRFTDFGDVSTTMRLKLFAEKRLAMFSIGANVATDVGGHDLGTVAQGHVALLLPLTSHGFVSIGPGLTWSDAQYMRAFYGVSAQQSSVSGLPQFHAGSGISDIYLEAVAGYDISSRWSVTVDAIAAHLHGDAADSPLTETNSQVSVLASIIYKIL
jgi:MipA family protein